MALRDRISFFSSVATATVATVATLDRPKEQKQVSSLPTVATVATVAVARTEKQGFQTSAEIIPQKSTSGSKGSDPTGHFQKNEVNPWDWLRPISDRQPCYAGREQGPSCFSCKSYDGKGLYWPGLCRFPESIGRVAIEIDWNVVDPLHGCGCYEPDIKRIAARDKETDFCFNDSLFVESTEASSRNDQPSPAPTTCKGRISPDAMS